MNAKLSNFSELSNICKRIRDAALSMFFFLFTFAA